MREECGPLWPTSQEDSLSTGWRYKSSWGGFFQFPPHALKLFQSTLKGCAKRGTCTWYIYFRYWTSAGREEHFMPNLCSQSSREKDLNLELSAHRQMLCLWGSCLLCFLWFASTTTVSLCIHDKNTKFVHTEIAGIYSSSLTFLVLFLVLNKNLWIVFINQKMLLQPLCIQRTPPSPSPTSKAHSISKERCFWT